MEKLNELISRLRAETPALSRGLFSLEEYVLLPHYGGNVMLRFSLSRKAAAGELDGLEQRLYSLLPEGVFADFMGEVYREAGVELAAFPERLGACAELYRDEQIPVSPFAGEVKAEAERLLALCGLPAGLPVWEIQPDEGETAILILGEGHKRLRNFIKGGIRYSAFTVETTPCEGLMRAAAYAKRTGVSLPSAVLRAGE